MDRGLDNRPQGQLFLSDYPSSYAPTTRARLWESCIAPIRPATLQMERPCIPRHAPSTSRQDAATGDDGLAGGTGTSRSVCDRGAQTNSGVLPDYCSKPSATCLEPIGEARDAGDESAGGASEITPSTAAQLLQLTNLITRQLQRVADTERCDSVSPGSVCGKLKLATAGDKPTPAPRSPPPTSRPSQDNTRGRGSRSVADTSCHGRADEQQQRCIPRPSLQFIPPSSTSPPTRSAATASRINTTADSALSDRPVPFEAWTENDALEDSDRRRDDTARYKTSRTRTSVESRTTRDLDLDPRDLDLDSADGRRGYRGSAARRRDYGGYSEDLLLTDYDERDWRGSADADDFLPSPRNYDEQLRKYGWRMEAHGDPYNLKRPYMTERPPYGHVMDSHSSNPPPLGRSVMGRSETMFQTVNSPYRARHDFTIHPDLATDNDCPMSLHSAPVSSRDIVAALMQRAGGRASSQQQRYVEYPFPY